MHTCELLCEFFLELISSNDCNAFLARLCLFSLTVGPAYVAGVDRSRAASDKMRRFRGGSSSLVDTTGIDIPMQEDGVVLHLKDTVRVLQSFLNNSH